VLNRRQLASEAVAQALWLRKKLRVAFDQPCCPIDAAEELGIEVRFMDIPSMEGMYVAGASPLIVLSSLRPQGRRNFTGAHEIGHHILGHGQQFDEMKETKGARRTVEPREFSADCFASHLLMPKSAVDNGMTRRKYTYQSLTSTQAYMMSNWLGVGYTSFVNHLQYGLSVISRRDAQQLLSSEPREIRSDVLGRPLPQALHIVDEAWTGRAVDCEVGDYLMLPRETHCEGDVLSPPAEVPNGFLAQVRHSGIARITAGKSDWAAFVRAARQKYVGRACYRFDVEIEE